MELLNEIWGKLVSVQAKPELWMILTSLGIALVATATPLWRFTRNLLTVVHEGGHALTAIIWGRRVSGITIHADTSGATTSSGSAWGLGAIFTTAAGYPAPALLGLLLAWLSAEGRVFLALAILALSSVLIFLSIRNFWGAIVTIPLAVGLYQLLQLEEQAQVFTLTAIAVLLTLASTRPIIELIKARAAREADDSDADKLQQLTFIVPGFIWSLLFLLISLAANVLAFYFMLKASEAI